jgi:hypothetical protein
MGADTPASLIRKLVSKEVGHCDEVANNVDIASWSERTLQWGIDRGIVGGLMAEDQMGVLLEEVSELMKAIRRGDSKMVRDSIGDTAVVLQMIAGIEGHDFVECLEEAYDEIKDRKGRIVGGKWVKETDL